MTGIDRDSFLERVRAHIASAGHHVTLVQGGASPRFAYTIGLTEAGAPELVLAGASSLTADEVLTAIASAAARPRGARPSDGTALDVPAIGAFDLAPVDPSWAERLLLGVYDYYDLDDADAVHALQLVPRDALRTVDVPDLSVAYDPEGEPVWRWLAEPWDLPIPADAITMTDLAALRGAPIAEAARWERDHWEMFAGPGPEVAPEDARAIPIATLLGFDPTLEPVTRLDVGEAIRREPPGPWEVWE